MSFERDGMEIWLNGPFLGRGSVTSIVETDVDAPTTTERSQRAEIVVKQSERSGMDLKGQWFIKKYVDGEATETSVSSREDGSKVLEYLRSAEIEGTFELVCRPETKDAVVERHHLAGGSSEDEEAPGSPGFFDESKTYIDKDGDKWRWREAKDSDHIGEWVCYHGPDEEDELVWKPTPPAIYGPYTEED